MRGEAAFAYPPPPQKGCDVPSWGSTQEENRKRVECRTIGFQKTVTEHTHKGLLCRAQRDRRLGDTCHQHWLLFYKTDVCPAALFRPNPGLVSAATSRIPGPG